MILRSGISRKRLAPAIAPIIVVGAALLPLLHEQTGHGGWIGNLPLRGRALGVPQNMAVGFYTPLEGLPWLVLAGLAAAVVFALRRGDEQERRGLALAGGVGLIGAAILVLPVITGNDYVTTRNLLALWVPFGIAAGIALGVKRSGVAWAGGHRCLGAALDRARGLGGPRPEPAAPRLARSRARGQPRPGLACSRRFATAAITPGRWSSTCPTAPR